MPFARLAVACPTCGSDAVFYTCTPGCCFNHLCDDCHTTFELATTALGGTVSDGSRAGLSDAPPEDGTAAHAPCATCDALAIHRDGDALACGACGANLALEYENVTPDEV